MTHIRDIKEFMLFTKIVVLRLQIKVSVADLEYELSTDGLFFI